VEVLLSNLFYAEVRMPQSHFGIEKRVKLWLESLEVTHQSLTVSVGVQQMPNSL
jgi:hypothetical protein